MPDAGDATGVAAAREYAGRLTAELSALIAPALAGAYLHGSAALGGWVAGRSDVDVLFVVADDVTTEAVAAAEDLLATAPGCPGRGLECSLVTVSQAARPAPPWPFVLHVNCCDGGRMRLGASMAGDADLLMHYAVCRAAGITLAGPPPAEAIGPVARAVILRYLAGELAWGLANAPECYAVLNACRALVFLDEDRIVSKIAGGLTALDRGAGPAGVIRRALDQQRGRVPERPAATDAVAFVQRAAATLRDAACRARPDRAPGRN